MKAIKPDREHTQGPLAGLAHRIERRLDSAQQPAAVPEAGEAVNEAHRLQPGFERRQMLECCTVTVVELVATGLDLGEALFGLNESPPATELIDQPEHQTQQQHQ